MSARRRSLQLCLHRGDNGVRIRKFARLQFRVDQLASGANLKPASGRRDQLYRTDALFELEQFFRQTDGFRFVVSDRAILNHDFRCHNARIIDLTGEWRKPEMVREGRSGDRLPRHIECGA
jgi:hypothetical protein